MRPSLILAAYLLSVGLAQIVTAQELPALPKPADEHQWLKKFVGHWEEGAKIVYGQRTERDESWVMRHVRSVFYRTVSYLADVHIPLNTAEFQLIDRQVLKAVLQSDDYYPYIRGMIANCGFRDSTRMVPYAWRARRSGVSKNRINHLVDVARHHFIQFIEGKIDAVIGHPSLREIVSAYPFRAVTAAYQTFPGLCFFLALLLNLGIHDACLQ